MKELNAQVNVRVGGLYRLRAGKNRGYIDANSGLWIPGPEVVTKATGWIENIITDGGLDMIGNDVSRGAYCHVGTGTTTEAATDTALETFVAAHLINVDVSKTYKAVAGGSPYYGYKVHNYRFDEGEAEGNISEVGISTQASSGDLFSRARVKDGGGSPTTIAVAADEFLDVDYEFRVYPDHVSADLDDAVSGEDFLLRAANVTTLGSMGTPIDGLAGFYANAGVAGVVYSDDAALGAVTSVPSASSSSSILGADCSNATYTPTNYYRDITYVVGLDQGNFGAGNGIKGLLFYTTMGAYQMLFDAEQAKDNTERATLQVRLAWSRASI